MRLLILLFLLAVLAGCATTADRTAVETHVDNSLMPIITSALQLRGAPFRMGGDSPDEGFDCSGFVQYVFSRHGYKLPRVSEDMAMHLPVVAFDERRPGDLLFFNTANRPHTHVGIYLGDNFFIHSPSSRSGAVMVSNLFQRYWSQRFDGVRRPLTNNP